MAQLDTSGQAVLTAPTPFDESEKEVAKMARDTFRRFQVLNLLEGLCFSQPAIACQSTNGFRICALLLGAFGPLIKKVAPRTEAAAVGLSVVGSNGLGVMSGVGAGESLISIDNAESEEGNNPA